MLNPNILKQKLAVINGRDYAGYQSLLGDYDFGLFKLIIQQIPKDPYAPQHTGIYRIQVQRNDKRIVSPQTKSKIQKIASADFLARFFFAASEKISKGIRGTCFSGVITINQPGQAILERNSVVITDELIEIRCFLGLPAEGRNIVSDIAAAMLLNELPAIVSASLLAENIDNQALKQILKQIKANNGVSSNIPTFTP